MLKILINNEEVVCDKQLEIKEEMLSTSSCILNNCYPKSWENTKDYTSQYYYPKDYSKCVIYDKNDEIYQNFQILGNCTQNGTPTPDNPIPIETVTGDITQIINNKNYTFSLGNIELCKVGNYQDYIYYDNGWYLHKATGKTNINVSAITLRSDYSNIEYAIIPKANDYIGYNKYGNNPVLYTHATFSNNPSNWNNYNNVNKIYSGAQLNNWWLGFAKGTGLENIKTKLSNSIIYYPLTNSTDTLITDTTLLKQLNTVGNELLFSGVVKNTGNINLNPRYPHYCNLEVLDFKTFLSECDQLDFVINNKTVSEAIEQVVQAVSSYGFVVGNININDDTIIGAYSTQEKTPYDVFQYLADISQSRWYTRLVDENTVAIDFYDPTEMQRGIDLDFSDNIFACQNNVEDLSFNYGTYDYRNKQIMLSNQVFGGVDFEETIVADGYNKIFNTTTPIGILKGITVNGSSSTFATNEDKEMGVEADFYYNPGQTQIESNENDGTYPANTIIIVGYTPLVKGRQVISDTTEISRIATQTGRNGTISRYEKRNDVLSSDELELIGNSYLKYKGTPEINLTLITKDVDLYNIGQIVYFNYPNIEDLSQDYMVKSKKTRIINTATDWNIWYTYTLTSNFNSENAINYFDNQRAKSTGNIQAGDYITRNVDIENSCMIIFSNPTATEITVADNNILNAPLNAPFTQ